jgi:voltage-gated potassium channel
MTTVGYGDGKPVSETGKIIASVLMLSGIGFFSVITAAFAQRFIAPEVAEAEEAVERMEETDALVLKEVHEITDRLRKLEAMVELRRARKE